MGRRDARASKQGGCRVKPCLIALVWALLVALPSRVFAQAESNAPAPSAPPPVAPTSSAPPPVAPPPAATAPAPASPQWLKAVYEQVADSVVIIETEYGTGSGFFFYSPRLVATALHVVDDADTI